MQVNFSETLPGGKDVHNVQQYIVLAINGWCGSKSFLKCLPGGVSHRIHGQQHHKSDCKKDNQPYGHTVDKWTTFTNVQAHDILGTFSINKLFQYICILTSCCLIFHTLFRYQCSMFLCFSPFFLSFLLYPLCTSQQNIHIEKQINRCTRA